MPWRLGVSCPGVQASSWLLVRHTTSSACCITYNSIVATDPKTRAPLEPARERGRSTRYRIIEQTARLCAGQPGTEPSVAQIAAAAGVFPNQVTYYFGSKDSLLVHAAFLGLLHDAEAIESVGLRTAD